ncbi:MAG: SGNH/GDSL hydrolase family protein [Gemmataceae bacterium]|nr:SGNH/GDSL hydrolase family protein [Gemmataceae bacterium]
MSALPKDKWKWVAVLLLVASLAVNVILVRACLRQYADHLETRLNPSGRRGPTWDAESKSRQAGESVAVFAGDSRIAMWHAPPNGGLDRVMNRGIGSETTGQLLLRFDRDVLKERPRIVIIQCGVNDLKTIGVSPGREQEIVRDCVEHLRLVTEKCRTAGIPVVLMTVWPCGRPGWTHELVWSDRIGDARRDVNRQIIELNGNGVEVIDCDDLLSESGLLSFELSLDHLHLNEKGYERVRDRLDAAIRKMTKLPE